MLSILKSRFGKMINRNTRYQNQMCVFCILFGLAMIANTHPAGDETWFWYATFLREGKRLYSDMHLALQPLYVLETATSLALMGNGWLVSKIPAVFHLVAYCLGLLLLIRRSSLQDRKKAVLLGCVFFLSINFDAYRFDDYHVVSDCFEIYSLVLLLTMHRSVDEKRTFGLAVGLGILSGLTITTRLNDGAALGLCVAVAIACLAPTKRLFSVTVFGMTAALTGVSVVRLTGDSFRDYAMYSVFHAAASKGGAGNVLLYPLRLPLNTLIWLKDFRYDELIFYSFAVAFIWVFLVSPVWSIRRSEKVNKGAFGKGLLGLFLILLPLPYLSWAIFSGYFIVSLAAVGTLATYVLGILVAVRFFRRQFRPLRQPEWNRREILLLVPLGQLASSSMSSGGQHRGLYGPLAVMILLVPFASPIQIRKNSTRSVLFALATLVIFFGATRKALVPFAWHSYQDRPMFIGRQWYRHPVYGPMIIDTRQLNFILQVCNRIGMNDPQSELLSLPLPYANYFCSTPPWHGYVQTFFDTSSKETIFKLISELQNSPPKWILYQRQLHNMALHEQIFNNGMPLAHRDLDQAIEQKLSAGEWQTVYTSNYGERPEWDNQWLLIRTRP